MSHLCTGIMKIMEESVIALRVERDKVGWVDKVGEDWIEGGK